MPKPILFDPVESPYLVPFDGDFKIDKADTSPPKDALPESDIAVSIVPKPVRPGA